METLQKHQKMAKQGAKNKTLPKIVANDRQNSSEISFGKLKGIGSKQKSIMYVHDLEPYGKSYGCPCSNKKGLLSYYYNETSLYTSKLATLRQKAIFRKNNKLSLLTYHC